LRAAQQWSANQNICARRIQNVLHALAVIEATNACIAAYKTSYAPRHTARNPHDVYYLGLIEVRIGALYENRENSAFFKIERAAWPIQT
jgi:hypothetical protein